MDLEKGLGFWKTIPIRRRIRTGSTPFPYISCSPSFTHPSARPGDHLVHPVQAPDKGALAATGRPDKSGNLIRPKIDVYVRYGLERAVERREVLDLHAQGTVALPRGHIPALYGLGSGLRSLPRNFGQSKALLVHASTIHSSHRPSGRASRQHLRTRLVPVP